jgi:crotonobetainyl-CoA:carnitine CoA-transferase CaiB-like acyl-CoA transferase
MNLLAGVRIIDLTRLLPGPLATWHLQSVGAEILKIEPPGEGDYARAMGPLDTDGVSFFYKHLNTGKTVRVLDLKSATDRAVLLNEVASADAVIESFRPGVMARLGLSLADLQAINPRIALISINGYGHTGPMAQAAGHDINYMAMAGMLHELIDAAAPAPLLPNLQFGDVLGGAMTAAFATVSAILSARIQGTGRHIDVSMTQALTTSNIMPLLATMSHGQPKPLGQDLLNGGVPCYNIYRTADHRFLAVGALELKFWQTLCDAIARTDLRNAHWQLGQKVGSAEAQGVREQLQAVFASQTLAHWQQHFAKVDCCVTPVLRMDEVLGLKSGVVGAAIGVV